MHSKRAHTCTVRGDCPCVAMSVTRFTVGETHIRFSQGAELVRPAIDRLKYNLSGLPEVLDASQENHMTQPCAVQRELYTGVR